MAAVNVNMTTASSQIPSGWEDDFIRAAQFEMVMLKRILMDWTWEKSKGDSIHVRRLVNWDAATKNHGVDATPTGFTDPGDQVLVINNFEIAIAQVEEVAALFLPDQYMTNMRDTMGYALARLVETKLTNLFTNLSQQVAGTALGRELTWADLLNANVLLRQAGINPDTEEVTVMCSPNQSAAFKSYDIFTNSMTAGTDGPENINKSMFTKNKILGASFFESNLLRSPATGQHDMAFFHRNCFAAAFAQKPKAFEEFRGIQLATIKGFWQAYGYCKVSRYGETPGDLTPVDNFGVFTPGV